MTTKNFDQYVAELGLIPASNPPKNQSPQNNFVPEKKYMKTTYI